MVATTYIDSLTIHSIQCILEMAGGEEMSTFRFVLHWIAFGLLWALVSAAGLLVDHVLFRGTFLSSGIVDALESWIGSEGWGLRVSMILSAGLLGLIDGFLLGLFQWAVVRRLVKRAYGWILGTSLGFSLGLMTFWSLMILLISGRLQLGSDLDKAFGLGLIDSAITGLILGFAQYLVLRRKVQHIQWWVPTILITMILAWIVRWFVGPGASFVAYGLVTGIVMSILGAMSGEMLEESKGEEQPVELSVRAPQTET
jgi:hypothetical protein